MFKFLICVSEQQYFPPFCCWLQQFTATCQDHKAYYDAHKLTEIKYKRTEIHILYMKLTTKIIRTDGE